MPNKLKTAEDEKHEVERKERIVDEAEGDGDLDDALDDSFPASDPPSMTQPKTRSGAPAGAKSVESTANPKK